MSGVYCGSPEAIKAAAAVWVESTGHPAPAHALASALIAAHTVELGLGRSVCLRDAVETLRNACHTKAADFLEASFTEVTRQFDAPTADPVAEGDN